MCRLVGEGGTGVHDGRAYLVMELLGASLAQLRAAAPGHRFELALVQSIGAPVNVAPHQAAASGHTPFSRRWCRASYCLAALLLLFVTGRR